MNTPKVCHSYDGPANELHREAEASSRKETEEPAQAEEHKRTEARPFGRLSDYPTSLVSVFHVNRYMSHCNLGSAFQG
jgi:hypothetical protein